MATEGRRLPQRVDAQAVGDPVQPGGDAAVRLPGAGALPQAHQRLLHHLFRLARACHQDRLGEAQQYRRHLADEPGEGARVAGGDRGHRRLVGVDLGPVSRVARLLQRCSPDRDEPIEPRASIRMAVR